MRDPIPRNNFNPRVSGYGSYGSSNSQFANGSGKGNNSGNTGAHAGRKKSDYCWNFNRGIPCKFGNKCKFIERCKYCNSPSHGVNNCSKLEKKSAGTKPVHESKTDTTK